ncbi:GAF domain-containing protein [Massilia sp. PAMC28688]|uniref:GAF domain-containing protein n=1 Tax=Massilia sp. PAMC28688 TaxID=2861283 RepID=UPI001C634769|nr:GAF domain-containing protein [Massilia sp. PAMC28688]QYF95231.1 GAF domain-containing protein [Massilia sp. PAMC28688]
MTSDSLPPLAAIDDPVLTTRQAAHYLGVSVSTAQLWMESGAIASWKTPGGHRRCRLSEIERVQRKGVAAPSGRATATPLAPEFILPDAVTYPVLPDEAQRLQALSASCLIGSATDPALDRITWLASQITQCPMALVSLLSAERQWFKSRVGVALAETPRDAAFCSHAILSEQGMVVEDALLEPRFAANPLVLGQPYIRFYAGVPVTDADGNRLGTLCVLDSRPRTLSPDQLRGLKELAQMVTVELARKK